MDTTVFFVILLATIMHAIWNAMVKHHPDKAINKSMAEEMFGPLKNAKDDKKEEE